MHGTLAVTGNEAADSLLNTDPLALLLGMQLDQQVPMEWAFIGPYRLRERLGGTLDAATIAAMAPEDLEAVYKEKPALHRFPSSMAKRGHELCVHVTESYGGDASKIWEGVETGAELTKRLKALPGYGDEKTKIFVAILAKRFDVRPTGWERAAGPFADRTPRSAADIECSASLGRVRAWKKSQKQKGKSKQD